MDKELTQTEKQVIDMLQIVLSLDDSVYQEAKRTIPEAVADEKTRRFTELLFSFADRHRKQAIAQQ